MIYTFQISDNTPQSQSIINMLLALSNDYSFLQLITKHTDNELTPEQEEELDVRYHEFIRNPNNGKTWNEVKDNLML